MEALVELSKVVVQLTGPLMVACIIIMFISVMLATGSAPKPTQVMYLYIKQNIAKRQHAGVLTYLLFVCALFFMLATAVLLYGHFALQG